MMIDLDRCIGCLACVSVCKERWDTGPGGARDWVYEYEHGRRGVDLGVTFYPGLCMQCEQHPCTEDCPTGATFMDERGVVVVDPDVCIGCANCVSTCAYGARHPDPVKGIVEKCNLCEPFVLRGEEPACVATCLAACRHFGDLDDPDGELLRLVQERGARPLAADGVDVGPRVTYAGDAHRAVIAGRGVVTAPERSLLTSVWSGATRPFARWVVPFVGVGSVVGGLVVNTIARRQERQREEASEAPAETLPRHRAGLRLLHWFNALSWLFAARLGRRADVRRAVRPVRRGLPTPRRRPARRDGQPAAAACRVGARLGRARRPGLPPAQAGRPRGAGGGAPVPGRRAGCGSSRGRCSASPPSTCRLRTSTTPGRRRSR